MSLGNVHSAQDSHYSVIDPLSRYGFRSFRAFWAIIDWPLLPSMSLSNASNSCRTVPHSGEAGNMAWGLEKFALGVGMISRK